MDVYYYIRQLYETIQLQQHELDALKRRTKSLEKEVRDLSSRPAVTVERLEYKFDQLKVETLEGTLNIGLNPSDLNGIEDISVPFGESGNSSQHLLTSAPFKQELSERLEQFLQKDLAETIRDTELQTGRSVSAEHLERILEDIRRQLPHRVEHYLQFFATRNHGVMERDEWLTKTFNTITADIVHAVHAYINQLPADGKD